MEFETEALRPVEAWCDENNVNVTLADGRTLSTPMAWYPFLLKADPKSRENIDLEYCGIWWPDLDEGLSIKGMFMGWKAPGVEEPLKAAE